MPDSDRYRQRAVQAEQLARQMGSPRQRERLEQLARDWWSLVEKAQAEEAAADKDKPAP